MFRFYNGSYSTRKEEIYKNSRKIYKNSIKFSPDYKFLWFSGWPVMKSDRTLLME